MRASDNKSASAPLERELFLFGFESPTTDSSGQTLYETTSGGKKFSKCFDLKFSTKVQNAASNLLLLHTMLYLSRHQFNFAIKANILLFLLSQIATKGTYLLSDKVTGLRAFEGHLPYQKYQGPPIVVR